MTCATWNLLAWLPVNPAEHLGRHNGLTGLDGPDVWKSVYQGELFFKLMKAIVSTPAHLIVL